MIIIGIRACVALSLMLFLAGPSIIQAQWESRQSDLPDWGNGWALDAWGSDHAVIAMIGDSGGTAWRTMNAGASWTRLAQLGVAKTFIDLSMQDSSAVWAATDNGQIWKWQLSSQGWTVQYSDTTVTTFMNYIKMFDAQHGIAMADARNDSGPAIFLRTTDGGAHWVSVNDSAFGGISWDTWRMLDFLNPSVGYFYPSGQNPHKLYRTNDACASWHALACPETLSVQVLKFYSEQLGLFYGQWYKQVGGTWIHGQNIARTTDGGASWQVFPCPASGWGNDIDFVPGDPSKVWMTDDVKLYFSADTGHTWTEKLDKGGRDIHFTDSLHGWMLGDNGVLYYTANGGDPPSAVTPHHEGVSAFALEQNYPNPFNPLTIIKYTVEGVRGLGLGVSNTRLVVYDLLGREVATLVDEPKQPGNYQATFDASGLSSGVYICRLSAGAFVQARRMLLLK